MASGIERAANTAINFVLFIENVLLIDTTFNTVDPGRRIWSAL
jgi:hypothetical protein